MVLVHRPCCCVGFCVGHRTCLPIRCGKHWGVSCADATACVLHFRHILLANRFGRSDCIRVQSAWRGMDKIPHRFELRLDFCHSRIRNHDDGSDFRDSGSRSPILHGGMVRYAHGDYRHGIGFDWGNSRSWSVSGVVCLMRDGFNSTRRRALPSHHFPARYDAFPNAGSMREGRPPGRLRGCGLRVGYRPCNGRIRLEFPAKAPLSAWRR